MALKRYALIQKKTKATDLQDLQWGSKNLGLPNGLIYLKFELRKAFLKEDFPEFLFST